MSDPFEAYLPRSQESPSSDDPFAAYLPSPPKSLAKKTGEKLEEFERHKGRTIARAAETALGAPRLLGEALQSLVPETLITKGAEKIGLGKPVKKGFEFAKKYAPYKLFPSAEEIRKNISEPLLGEKIKPQSPQEEKADELVQDFVNLAIPFPGGKLKFFKPAMAAIGGSAAKDLAAQLGASPEAQQYAKIGTMIFSSLLHPGAGEKAQNEFYSAARNARPERVRVESKILMPGLNKIEREITRGGTESWQPKLLTKIKELKDRGAGNTWEVGELEKFKKSINNITSELYAEKNVGKPGIKTAQRYITQLNKLVGQGLEKYANVNPEWGRNYFAAQEIFGARSQSHKARNLIANVADKMGAHYLIGALGFGHFGGASGVAKTLGAAVAGKPLLQGAELAAQFSKSPELRKLYTNLITSALKDDLKAVHSNLQKIKSHLPESTYRESSPE